MFTLVEKADITNWNFGLPVLVIAVIGLVLIKFIWDNRNIKIKKMKRGN